MNEDIRGLSGLLIRYPVTMTLELFVLPNYTSHHFRRKVKSVLSHAVM